jgi:hypothetical protein
MAWTRESPTTSPSFLESSCTHLQPVESAPGHAYLLYMRLVTLDLNTRRIVDKGQDVTGSVRANAIGPAPATLPSFRPRE